MTGRAWVVVGALLAACSDSGGSSNEQLEADIAAEIEKLNSCDTVSDCEGVNFPVCSTRYVRSGSDRSTLDRLLEDYGTQNRGVACTTDCKCGVLTCEQNRCVTASGDCETAPPDGMMVCL